MNTCDPYAECVFDDAEQQYVCQCVDGYSGDGFQCTDTGECKFIWSKKSVVCHTM